MITRSPTWLLLTLQHLLLTLQQLLLTLQQLLLTLQQLLLTLQQLFFTLQQLLLTLAATPPYTCSNSSLHLQQLLLTLAARLVTCNCFLITTSFHLQSRSSSHQHALWWPLPKSPKHCVYTKISSKVVGIFLYESDYSILGGFAFMRISSHFPPTHMGAVTY